jgi:hypothetical protein
MLRFAFSEQAVGPAAALELLHSLESALQTYLPALQEELKSIKPVISTSGRLAFEFGIRGTDCLLDWCRYAITTYEKER